ncbi:hypothetical protein OG592_42390 (plasmid) [Streptomyces avidinii]|uniref:hypothetical protein n=1 Tax=Streptomyces avidinii TaxID=1895 RepID=UPI002F917046|nr:hypothetical protein OG592_42390 [Streptomyces avidinii]
MGGQQDKRRQPGEGREEQLGHQRPGQDPVHPEPGTPARGGQHPQEGERSHEGREEDLLRDERDLRDDGI